MLKIVYPICCGMDVHKNFVAACIAATDENGVSSFCSVRAISLPLAPLDRLCCYIFSAIARWPVFVRPFRDGACVTMFQTY